MECRVVRCGVVWWGEVSCGKVYFSVVWCGAVWWGVLVQCGVVWFSDVFINKNVSIFDK